MSRRGYYDPQTFDSFWKPFIRVFQAFCMSHYSIFHTRNHYGRLVYFIIFSIFDNFINSYSLVQIFHLDKSLYQKCWLMYFVSFMSIGSHIVMHVIFHLEALCTLQQQEEMCQKIRDIDKIFTTKLNYQTDFDAIRRNFARTAGFFVFTATFLIVGAFQSHPTDSSMLTFVLCRFLVVSANFIKKYQIAIHMKMLTNILMDLKIVLAEQQQDHRLNLHGSTLRENIQSLREVYCNAWLIAKLLNGCFGWTLVFYLTESTIDLINSSYQYYLNVKVYKSTYNVIRESPSLFIEYSTI